LAASAVPDPFYEKIPLPPSMQRSRKAVLFLMDVSGSMSVNMIGPTTRLEACKARIRSLIMNEHIVGLNDLVGLVAFGAGHRRLLPRVGGSPGPSPSIDLASSWASGPLPITAADFASPPGSPTARSPMSQPPIVGPVNRRHVAAVVEEMELERAQASSEKEYGLELCVYERNGVDLKSKKLGNFTFLYSSLCFCVNDFMHERYSDCSRWLILLCDGDDSGGGRSEGYTRELLAACGGDLNLVIISVGTAVTSGSVLQSMVDTVAGSGGVGKYIAATEEDDDRALRSAFAQVEESLLIDSSGQVEVGGS